MVPGGGNAVQLQILADLLHGLPGGAVDNARLVPALLHQLDKGGQLLLGPPDLKAEIGPVKACDHPQGIAQLQNLGDVLAHCLRCRGGKGGNHGAWDENVQKIHNFQIAGPEILAPLGDAVGLVHRHQGDLPGLDGLQKAVGQQPLRGHIDDLVHSGLNVAVDQPDLGRGQGAVDIGCGYTGIFQGHDLVPHQGDQGRDHQRDPFQQQGGDLVAQALAAAGGHNAEGILPPELRIDQRLLPAPKGRIAKDPLQDRFLCFHVFPLFALFQQIRQV